ncbi:MAG TPA: heterodisulfide reductase-related iron-sulfur binding cluster [Thermomicrobiales bacterium]|nr:heterodisulfide reductase-related iron-sulfur binding cluster [Thermomicrobiales bacterium]
MAIAEHADLKRLGGFSGHDIPDPDLLKACVHCGMCLSSCPTYRLTGQEMSSPRGRLWMMSAVAENRLDLLDPAFTEQMYQCLNCRACEAVCPSGVQYGPLVEASRAQIEQHQTRPVHQRALRRVALGWLFGEAGRFRAFTRATALYQKSGLSFLAHRTGILRLLKLEDSEAMLPPIKARPLQPGTESWTPRTARERAVLFNGCIMGTVFADVNRAAGRVMAHNGIAVEVPVKQQCCGALQVHSGMMDEARDLARRNIEAFEASGNETIVVTAAGCGAALKEYGHLLHADPVYAERARDFSSRVKDVNEYLGSQPIVEPSRPVKRTVTYQEPCHLAHAQRVTVQPRTLLKSIQGVELIEMKESSLCCGSAGIYNILRKDFADRLGDRKAANTKATGASTVVTANPGCFLQLRSTLTRNGADMDVKYVVELLDEAYGGSGVTEWAIDRSTHRSS